MSVRLAAFLRAFLVIGVAIVMAFISAKLLFNGSVVNVVPWGILAFATSFLASSKREAWTLGGIFGFVVSYAFLWFDNTGTKTHLNHFDPHTAYHSACPFRCALRLSRCVARVDAAAIA